MTNDTIINLKKINPVVDKLLLIAPILLYLCYLIPANIDFSAGGFLLDMDEQISFDAIQSILNINQNDNLLDIIKSLIGGDQRYGRIIYIFSSIFAFLPEKIWGETGQIIAVRMLLFILNIFSYFLLSKIFFKTILFSRLTFVSLLLIPTTAYFSTMPKPEPFQLFFFSLFLYYHIKNNYYFKFHFIFLGLAFGCKISLLFPVLFIFIHSLAHSHKGSRLLELEFIKKGIFHFLLGLFIAVPILPLSLVMPKLFKDYLYSTFLGTSHGSDDSTVNFFVWIKQIIINWIQAPPIYTLLVSFFTMVVIFVGIYILFNEFKNKIFNSTIIYTFSIALLSIIPIILFTKRIWFFYLHSGIIFLVITFFIALEVIMNKKIKYLKYPSVFVLILFCIYSITFSFKTQITELNNLASRTKSKDYLLQLEKYNYIAGYLQKEQNHNNKLSIYYDPYLFRYKSSFFTIRPFWGYFNFWHKNYDLIIMSDNTLLTKLKPPAKTNYQYNSWKIAISNFKKYVNQVSSTKYELVSTHNVNGLYIFKRIN